MNKLCPGLHNAGEKCYKCIHAHHSELAPLCAHTGSGSKFCETTKTSISEDRWESSVTQLKVSNGICPGSKAWVHAKTQLAVSFKNSCADVMKEINLRVSSQASGAWVDPHNGGKLGQAKYTIESSTANSIHLHHLTGNGKYTDELILTFAGVMSGDGVETCSVTACSESQVTSVLDFSTNYCNLHDLYCSDPECNADNLKGHTKLTYTEKIVENSSKQHSTSDCYKSKPNSLADTVVPLVDPSPSFLHAAANRRCAKPHEACDPGGSGFKKIECCAGSTCYEQVPAGQGGSYICL